MRILVIILIGLIGLISCSTAVISDDKDLIELPGQDHYLNVKLQIPEVAHLINEVDINRITSSAGNCPVFLMPKPEYNCGLYNILLTDLSTSELFEREIGVMYNSFSREWRMDDPNQELSFIVVKSSAFKFDDWKFNVGDEIHDEITNYDNVSRLKDYYIIIGNEYSFWIKSNNSIISKYIVCKSSLVKTDADDKDIFNYLDSVQ